MKCFWFVRRDEQLAPSDFMSAWRARPWASELPPGSCRFVENLVTDPSAERPAPIDAFVEVHFPSVEAFDRHAAAGEWVQRLAGEAMAAGPVGAVATTEYVFLWNEELGATAGDAVAPGQG